MTVADDPVAKSSPGSEREFVISTPTVDRMNDSINVGGWQVRIEGTPWCCGAIKAETFPLAAPPRFWIESGKLRLHVVCRHPYGRESGGLLDQGVLKATSVGFRPLAWPRRHGFWHIVLISYE